MEHGYPWHDAGPPPPELFERVLDFLDARDLFFFRLVCRQAFSTASSALAGRVRQLAVQQRDLPCLWDLRNHLCIFFAKRIGGFAEKRTFPPRAFGRLLVSCGAPADGIVALHVFKGYLQSFDEEAGSFFSGLGADTTVLRGFLELVPGDEWGPSEHVAAMLRATGLPEHELKAAIIESEAYSATWKWSVVAQLERWLDGFVPGSLELPSEKERAGMLAMFDDVADWDEPEECDLGRLRNFFSAIILDERVLVKAFGKSKQGDVHARIRTILEASNLSVPSLASSLVLSRDTTMVSKKEWIRALGNALEGVFATLIEDGKEAAFGILSMGAFLGVLQRQFELYKDLVSIIACDVRVRQKILKFGDLRALLVGRTGYIGDGTTLWEAWSWEPLAAGFPPVLWLETAGIGNDMDLEMTIAERHLALTQLWWRLPLFNIRRECPRLHPPFGKFFHHPTVADFRAVSENVVGEPKDIELALQVNEGRIDDAVEALKRTGAKVKPSMATIVRISLA
ncbi:hypothetical protein DFJ74DRAFT_705298 [Hyaloraphidium curvatum]|nr:hypothetical protein DFJ74DRAFT_705298 [Hyaloraphidium curvatum]